MARIKIGSSVISSRFVTIEHPLKDNVLIKSRSGYHAVLLKDLKKDDLESLDENIFVIGIDLLGIILLLDLLLVGIIIEFVVGGDLVGIIGIIIGDILGSIIGGDIGSGSII